MSTSEALPAVTSNEVTISVVIVTVLIVLVICNLLMYTLTRVLTDPKFWLREMFQRRGHKVPRVRILEVHPRPFPSRSPSIVVGSNADLKSLLSFSGVLHAEKFDVTSSHNLLVESAERETIRMTNLEESTFSNNGAMEKTPLTKLQEEMWTTEITNSTGRVTRETTPATEQAEDMKGEVTPFVSLQAPELTKETIGATREATLSNITLTEGKTREATLPTTKQGGGSARESISVNLKEKDSFLEKRETTVIDMDCNRIPQHETATVELIQENRDKKQERSELKMTQVKADVAGNNTETVNVTRDRRQGIENDLQGTTATQNGGNNQQQKSGEIKTKNENRKTQKVQPPSKALNRRKTEKKFKPIPLQGMSKEISATKRENGKTENVQTDEEKQRSNEDHGSGLVKSEQITDKSELDKSVSHDNESAQSTMNQQQTTPENECVSAETVPMETVSNPSQDLTKDTESPGTTLQSHVTSEDPVSQETAPTQDMSGDPVAAGTTVHSADVHTGQIGLNNAYDTPVIKFFKEMKKEIVETTEDMMVNDGKCTDETEQETTEKRTEKNSVSHSGQDEVNKDIQNSDKMVENDSQTDKQNGQADVNTEIQNSEIAENDSQVLKKNGENKRDLGKMDDKSVIATDSVEGQRSGNNRLEGEKDGGTGTNSVDTDSTEGETKPGHSVEAQGSGNNRIEGEKDGGMRTNSVDTDSTEGETKPGHRVEGSGHYRIDGEKERGLSKNIADNDSIKGGRVSGQITDKYKDGVMENVNEGEYRIIEGGMGKWKISTTANNGNEDKNNGVEENKDGGMDRGSQNVTKNKDGEVDGTTVTEENGEKETDKTIQEVTMGNHDDNEDKKMGDCQSMEECNHDNNDDTKTGDGQSMEESDVEKDLQEYIRSNTPGHNDGDSDSIGSQGKRASTTSSNFSRRKMSSNSAGSTNSRGNISSASAGSNDFRGKMSSASDGSTNSRGNISSAGAGSNDSRGNISSAGACSTNSRGNISSASAGSNDSRGKRSSTGNSSSIKKQSSTGNNNSSDKHLSTGPSKDTQKQPEAKIPKYPQVVKNRNPASERNVQRFQNLKLTRKE